MLHAVMLRRALGRLAAAATVLAVVVAPMLGAPAARADGWSAPTLSREIGGPSSAQVYAWGTDFNPVTHELLVGDYVDKTVRRYSPSGAYLGNTDGPTSVGLYAGIGVDPRDGSFYVGTQQGNDGVVLKFNAAGHFMFSFDTPGLAIYPTVDAAGYLYLNNRSPNSFWIDKLSVDDASHGYTLLQRFSAPGGTWYNDVAVASDGRVFAVQQDQYRVRVFDASGAAIGQIGARGSGPGLFKGDMRGVAINEAADRIYVVDGEGNAVEVFTLDGTYVATWGSVGNGPGQFQDGGRQISVGSDGTVYVADYGNFRIVAFSATGAPQASIPNPSVDPDSWGFNSLVGVAYDPSTGNVLGVDAYNQRFQRFSADGRLLDSRGRRGNAAPYGMNYPKGIAVDPATGQVWVVNYEFGHPDILVFNTDGSFNREVVEPAEHRAVAIYHGEAYIIASGVLDVRNVSTGALVRSWAVAGLELGIDPANGNVYVPNGKTVSIFTSAGVALGTLSGGKSLYDATVVGNVVYVTDGKLNQILAFDKTTTALLGSFGGAGASPGQLRLPQGIDSDAAGNLYVADRGNARIDVFSAGSLPVDTTKPKAALSAPASGSTINPGPAVITGSATDSGSGVAAVEVALSDGAGQWWEAKSSTWKGAQIWNNAAVSGPLAAMQWRFGFTGATPGRSYQVIARARDRAQQAGRQVSTSFTVGDPIPPDTTLTSPASASLSAGTVSLAGQASDNVRLSDVKIAAKDQSAGTWWDPQAQTWGPTQVWFSAALAAPGAPTSAWSSSVPATAVGHTFVIYAQAVDEVGQADPSPATVTFTTTAPPDLPPDTAITSPQPGTSVSSPANLTGTASDDVGVAGVSLSIQDQASGMYWDGTGFVAGPVSLAAVLDSPNATSTGWSLSAALPAGSYQLSAQAGDVASQPDPTPASLSFSVS